MMFRQQGGNPQRQVLDRLAAVLADAQRQRASRAVVAGSPRGDGEPAWVAWERSVMHAEVNRARAELGAGPVRVEEVARAERLAVGHIDYSAKFALHCRDLVFSAVSEPSPGAAAAGRTGR